jgi:hypothetical protein
VQSPRHVALRGAAAAAAAAVSLALWALPAKAGAVEEPIESAVLNDTVQVKTNLFCGVRISAYRYQHRIEVISTVNDTKGECLIPVATFITATYTTAAGDTQRTSVTSESYRATLQVEGSFSDLGETIHSIYWRNAGTVWEQSLTPTK